MVKNLAIEGAELKFRNFRGEAGKFNKEGERSFCVMLDPENAMALKEDGWNVKFLPPRDDEDESRPYLPVKVRFGNRPPKCLLITSRGKTILDEDSIASLDWADLENVDLIINPYEYDFNGRSGISAYLKAGYFTIVEDEFESKYYGAADVSDEY